MIRCRQLKVPLNYDEALLRRVVAKRLHIPPALIVSLEVIRRSLDCRHHEKNIEPTYQLTLDIRLRFEWDEQKRKLPQDFELVAESTEETIPSCSFPDTMPRPIVVGAGPAGLFAALTLAEAGAKPVLVERGGSVEERQQEVREFWENGTLNPESNVLFGEGGAGLFSDGKLLARTKDRQTMRMFFKELVEAGAKESILIDAEPHIGTDELQRILPAIREKIIRLGGEVRFNCCLKDVKVENGQLQAVLLNDQWVEASVCVLATGHSARDMYQLLHQKGFNLEAKSFAIGVRLELPQQWVDQAMYGQYASGYSLPAANFKLISKAEAGKRSVYSFCMCPGGEVIVCASEPGRLTTNGMSDALRDSPYANAAFLVPVSLEDFGGKDCLSGMRFQQRLEEEIFAYTSGRYVAVGQTLEDFLNERPTQCLPSERSCQQAIPGDLDEVLPSFVCRALREALPSLMKKLVPNTLERILLYGIETRSSAPVRILRDEKTLWSLSAEGLYPCGEGAGYAGGITTSAIDGIKIALKIIESYGTKI